MASISSLSGSSSTSSIYGSRNVLSGLASGMDTEAMIENAVSGIKTKIASLQKRRTKVEWQQEAYRSIIDKMVNLSNKYTSYASSTNLMSSSFFNGAVITTAEGEYANKVTASGKTSSDVKLLGVQQLAKAASYSVSGLGGAAASQEISGERVRMDDVQALSNVAGTMTINYGGTRSVDLVFDDLTTYKDVNELADGIKEKLGDISMTTSTGESKKASEMIKVEVKNGNIVFSDAQGAGNSVYVSSSTGKIKDTLGIDPSAKSDTLRVKGKALVDKSATVGDYVSGKTMSVTLDGVTKKITMPEYEKGMSGDDYVEKFQEQLDKTFGKGKLTVENKLDGGDTTSSFSLKISAQKGSTVRFTGDAAKAMGLSENGAANYMDTGKKLSELLGSNFKWDNSNRIAADGAVREVAATKSTPAYFVDAKGNRVSKASDGNYYQVDNNNKFVYDFKINDVSIGKFNEDTALESVMTAINSNADAGVKMSYSKMTNEFQFTATETGTSGKIEFGGLAKDLFGQGGRMTEGQDAILTMEVNGVKFENISRSGNSFDVDGLTINLKGTFETGEDEDPVTFTTTSDTDKIVDAIKSFVDDYNEMVTEIKNAYSTQPATKSNKSRYEPLTDDDKDGMSDSAIERYEELAKQGILFGDSNLSSLYSKLRSAISPGGADGQTLREIGINTSYSGGLTTLSLDETALRNALESDPDKVKNAFTKSTEGGSGSDGLMITMKNTLDTYAKTTGEPKGVLIVRAGSARAPTSLNSNSLLSQINSIDQQIERWENKMSDQIDRYTTQFTRLEQLIAEMNSQSSALSGLMVGGSYY